MRIWAAHLPHEGDLALFLEHKDAVSYVEWWNVRYAERIEQFEDRQDFFASSAMRVVPREVRQSFDPVEEAAQEL